MNARNTKNFISLRRSKRMNNYRKEKGNEAISSSATASSSLVDIKKIKNNKHSRILNTLHKKEKKLNVDKILRYEEKMKYRNRKAFNWE